MRLGVGHAVRRRLVDHHDVRERLADAVVLEHHGLQRAREVGNRVVVQLGRPARRAWRDPHFVRVLRERGHERHDELPCVDDAAAVLASRNDVLLEQAASIAFEMTALHRDLARGDGGTNGYA
jgi:hypothetical protein